jgi:hypothetical protein
MGRDAMDEYLTEPLMSSFLTPSNAMNITPGLFHKCIHGWDVSSELRCCEYTMPGYIKYYRLTNKVHE